MGEDDCDVDADAASVTANTLDADSVADSLLTEENYGQVEEEEDQDLKNRKRQKMWRSYRRKLQLAKDKETTVLE